MSEVVLSSAVRSNLLNLQSTAELLGKTQERLATGKKVNSALDNPTNFFTASSLNSRASDLGRLLDSVSNAVQTIAAADKGITAITKLVESAQATARQALQTSATVDQPTLATAGKVTAGAFTAVDVSAPAVVATSATLAGGAFTTLDISGGTDAISFDLTVDGAATPTTITIDSAAVTAYNTANSTTLDDTALTAQDIVDLINDQAGATVASLNSGNIDLTSPTTGATSDITVANFAESVSAGTTGLADGTDTGVAASGDAITFSVNVDGAGAQSVTISDATVTAYNTANSTSLDSSALSAADIALLINDQTSSTVASVVSGALTFTSGTTGTTSSVAITGYTASVSGGSTGISDASNSGVAAGTASVANPKRDELRIQYNDLLTQIDALAKDAGFNGVNLLNGDSLSVLFNEDGTSKLDITGVTYDSTGLGLGTLASGAFDLNTGINGVLDDLKDVTDTLRTQSSKFGSNLSVVEARQDFTKNMINVLETGAANLTLADTNEEAANLLALQTRQQLSSTALSLASQADQNVLRLF